MMKPIYLILLFSTTLLIIFSIFLHYLYIDDAYISLRYAQNLLAGNGLVWNVGERVEGYTNFLFVMLIVMFNKIGFDLILASYIIPVGSFVILIFYLKYFLFEMLPKKTIEAKQLTAALLGIIISSPPLIAWSFGGLETTLFVLLITISSALTAQHLTKSHRHFPAMAVSIILLLATMTRPEGALFFVLTFLFVAAYNSRKSAIQIVAIYAPAIIGYFSWKYYYYGDILPNTYYTKSYDIPLSVKIPSGIKYIGDFLAEPPFIIVLVIFALIRLIKKRSLSPSIQYLSTLFIAYLTYVITIGGGWMNFNRMCTPLITLGVLHLFWTLFFEFNLSKEIQKKLSYFVILLLLLQLMFFDLDKIAQGNLTIKSAVAIGKYIDTHYRGQIIAANAVGANAYYAPNNTFIDMLGLNDKHIARIKYKPSPAKYGNIVGHMKSDGKYVLSKQPDIIILGPFWGTDQEHPYHRSDHELIILDNFNKFYRKQMVKIKVNPSFPDYAKTILFNKQPFWQNEHITFTYYKRIKNKSAMDANPS